MTLSPSFFYDRYTEELFATLIAFIFIFNAFKNVSSIGSENKFAPTTLDISCKCNLSSGEEAYNITKTECVEVNPFQNCKNNLNRITSLKFFKTLNSQKTF